MPFRRPSPALCVAVLALFVALGGTGYAALALPRHSVGPRALKNHAVLRSKLHRGAVTSPKVRDGSLLARDFAAGQLPRGPRGEHGSRGERGPRGDRGPAGAKGAAGARGPSDAYAGTFHASGIGESPTEVFSARLPAGAYTFVVTMHWGGTGGKTRCLLQDPTGTIDAEEEESPGEEIVALSGARSYTAETPVKVICGSISPDLSVTAGQFAAIRVANLHPVGGG